MLTADGYSTSVIQVTLRDQNGSPVAGRAVIFTVANGEVLRFRSGKMPDILNATPCLGAAESGG